jgi:hypothetical protein
MWKLFYLWLSKNGRFAAGMRVSETEEYLSMVDAKRERYPDRAALFDASLKKYFDAVSNDYYRLHPERFLVSAGEILGLLRDAGFCNFNVIPSYHQWFGVFSGEKP